MIISELIHYKTTAFNQKSVTGIVYNLTNVISNLFFQIILIICEKQANTLNHITKV